MILFAGYVAFVFALGFVAGAVTVSACFYGLVGGPDGTNRPRPL